MLVERRVSELRNVSARRQSDIEKASASKNVTLTSSDQYFCSSHAAHPSEFDSPNFWGP